MTDNNNTPAFPTTTWEQLPNGQIVQVTEHSGLTKREKIAAMMMQGLLSSWGRHDITNYDEMANDAVMAADALLDELSKPQP